MNKIKPAFVTLLFLVTSFTTINAQMISLTAKGEVKVTPDIATTNISIQKNNKDIKVLRKEILQISKDLNKQLSKLHIDKKDIQTSNLQINKEYGWIKGKKIFNGYRANIGTSVTFRDISKLEKTYTELLNNEDIIVNGVRYDYSKKTEAENEAYLKALNNANTLAEKLAKKISSKPKHIESVSNNNTTTFSPSSPIPMLKAARFKSTAMNMDSAPSIDINSGTITIRKSLTVVYKLY